MSTLPDVVRTDSLEVEVHLSGPGYGECTLIVIGGKVVLGIDCCLAMVHETLTKPSYLESVINGLGSDYHLFWLLTHYHFDHFHGLASVLERWGPNLQSLVVPSDHLPADFAHLIALDAEREQGTRAAYFHAKGEYERLRQVMSEGGANAVEASQSGRSVWFQTELEGKDGRRLRLRATLDSLTPSRLKRMLARAVSALINDPVTAHRKRELGNEGSYVLHLSAGDFDAVFLGDAPVTRTEAVDWESLVHPRGDLLLKVSHHGAEDGTSGKLLGALQRGTGTGGKREALIAPFVRHRLPRREVLRLLNDHGFRVSVSGRQRKRHGTKRREIESLGRSLARVGVSSYQEADSAFIVLRFSLEGAALTQAAAN